MKKNREYKGHKEIRESKKHDEVKSPPPREFITTELGSAVFASIDGRPTDEEYLIREKSSRDDVEDGASDSLRT